MMLIAHIQGVPVEELLPTLAGSMTAGLLMMSSLVARFRRMARR